jgi:hypothetical protein
MSRFGHNFLPQEWCVLSETGEKTLMISMGIFGPDTEAPARLCPRRGLIISVISDIAFRGHRY